MSEPITLTADIVEQKRLTITLLENVTIEQVVEALNSQKASISGDEIIKWSEPPAEGGAVLAKVLSMHEEAALPIWQVQPAKSHSSSCCALSEDDRLRFQANQIRHQADLILLSGGDQNQADALIKAAGVLLDRSGGRDNEPGIWLLASEAVLCQQRGDCGRATVLLKEAFDRSVAKFGIDDPSTLGCQGNYAQHLLELGDPAGKALLADAIEKLRKAKPTRDASQAWINGGIAEFTSVLEKASAHE